MWYYDDSSMHDEQPIVNFPMPKPVGADYKYPFEIREAARQKMIQLLEQLRWRDKTDEDIELECLLEEVMTG